MTFFSALICLFLSTNETEVQEVVSVTADFYNHDSFWVLSTPYSELSFSLLTQLGKNKRKGTTKRKFFYLNTPNHNGWFSPLYQVASFFLIDRSSFLLLFLRHFHSCFFLSDFFFFFLLCLFDYCSFLYQSSLIKNLIQKQNCFLSGLRLDFKERAEIRFLVNVCS